MSAAFTYANNPTGITPSILDGYLAAVFSGPKLVMSDQVLR